MKQWKRRTAILGIAGMTAMGILTGCGSMNNEDTVITVGEESVPLGVANFYARLQQAQYETYFASMMGTGPEEFWAQDSGDGKTYEESMKENMLESLENLYLIRQHAEEYDVALTDEETTAIEDAAEQFEADNADDEKEAVSGYQEYVKEYLELITLQQKMQEPMQADADTEVSDEEAAMKGMQYVFFSFTTTDESGNSVDLSENEIATVRTTAQLFTDNLKESENKDMEAAAQEAGVEVQTATFNAESTSPDADLIAAADALTNVGDITDAIETDAGIYVAKLTTLLDREATDSNKETIVSERQQEAYNALLDQWREDTKITVNDKLWEKIDFQKQGVNIKTTETEDSTGTDSSTDTQSGTETEDGTDDSTETDGDTAAE